MSLCERVMVLTRFDAVLKQIPLEQVYRAHVRVLDDSGILSYCDSLLKPTRCTMLCHCGIRRMCSHPLFSPILLLYKPFSCPSGHELRNPETIHKTVITRKVRCRTCSMHFPPAPPASAHAIRSLLGPGFLERSRRGHCAFAPCCLAWCHAFPPPPARRRTQTRALTAVGTSQARDGPLAGIRLTGRPPDRPSSEGRPGLAQTHFIQSFYRACVY